MSAQTYEPLRVVPPLETKQRVAWLLTLRHQARRAFDAVLAVPRKAATYVASLFRSSGMAGAASWLRGSLARIGRPLMTAAARLGRTGVLAGVTSIVTSPTGQAVIRKVGGFLGRALGWVARKTYSLVDRGLRCFGRTGNKAADALFSGVVSLGGKLASLAAPVVYRVARFADAQTPQARLLNSIARSYVLHRLFKALIANPYLRLLIEGFVIPVLVDSRVGQWVRQQVRTVRLRATSLREQTEKMSPQSTDGVNGSRGADRPDTGYEPPMASGEDVPMPLWLVDEDLTPFNRAERRAAQRTGQRNPKHK